MAWMIRSWRVWSLPFLVAVVCGAVCLIFSQKKDAQLSARAPGTLSYKWGYFLGYSGLMTAVAGVIGGLMMPRIGFYPVLGAVCRRVCRRLWHGELWCAHATSLGLDIPHTAEHEHGPVGLQQRVFFQPLEGARFRQLTEG
jgi:hypothetical protein